LFKVGRSALKLEEIMWKSNYEQFYTLVKGTFFCFTLERPVTATDRIQKLVKSWQKGIEGGGDYVEK
jgi:hypothetical protein